MFDIEVVDGYSLNPNMCDSEFEPIMDLHNTGLIIIGTFDNLLSVGSPWLQYAYPSGEVSPLPKK